MRCRLAACSLLAATALALGVAAALMPAPAAAHAVVEETVPSRGAALARAPERVSVRFDEPVETTFGAVRVFDADGERVDSGELLQPRSGEVAIALSPGLPDGPYTATYRVVSADSHPVSGGFVFTVGESGGTAAGAVADLLEGDEAGPVTGAAFGVVRGIGYGAIALVVGGLAFLLGVWLPALRVAAGGGESWRAASEAFAARARTLLLIAAAVGAGSCLLGLVLQGATAAGTGFWAALDPSVLADVLATRFGTVWSLRLLAFAAIAAVVALPFAAARVPMLRPASLGATGLAAPGRPGWPVLGLLALPVAVLVASPALAGHAGADSQLVLVPADVVHVAAMSVWVGGIALLLLALPAATRRLEGTERTRLLAAALARFSPLALLAVAVLVATGVVQSIVHLESLSDLTASAFGRAILVKSALLLGLVGLGAYQRQRMRPRFQALAAGDEPPGATGLLLRRALRSELATMAVVLGVTAALVSYSPPAGAAAGPFSAARDLGEARLELTVEPARVGANEIHIYLFDRQTGAQYDEPSEVSVRAELPERDIGPLELEASKTGPGHYTVRRADLLPAGDWTLSVRALVSDFEEPRAEIEVPIE